MEPHYQHIFKPMKIGSGIRHMLIGIHMFIQQLIVLEKCTFISERTPEKVNDIMRITLRQLMEH